MKKSIIKSIALGIGGLLSLSFLFGAGLSNQFINKEENNNINQLNIRKYINTEGTKLPSSGGSLASGTYYLDSDLTLTNYITCASGRNIIINLNGFSLSAKPNSNQTIVYVKGGTLTINGKDDESGTMGTLCNGTGYYDGSYTRGGAIAIYADGTSMGNVTVNDCNIGNNTAAFAGAIFISKGSTATLNNCNVYNNDSTSDPSYGYRGALYVEDVGSTLNINGGEIYGNEGGVLLWGNNSQSSSANLNGVYVHDNAKFGVRLHGSDNGNAPLTIAGDTIIKNNPTESSTEQANLRLNGSNRGKFTFPSGLGENAYIGITMQGSYGVFTSGWSQYMGDADFNDYFFSDTTAAMIGKNPSGELLVGTPRTVTYSTEHGTAPDQDTVANGSIILNEPTSPSETGYAFQGWYKESTFENAWNFASDTVTADTTLYAKWESYVLPVATVTSGETVTEYSDFSVAVSAWKSASNGATLTLLNDVNMSSPITIDDKTKTFDLNGYGLNASSISSSADYAILVNNGGNLTLNDSGNTTHYFIHERYKGYDAGLATICDENTYNAASEDSRGTFEGGYLTGLSIVKAEVSQAAFFKIEENSSVTMNGGTIIGIYADYSSSCVCSNGSFIMNDGNMIYNVNARGCINARSGLLTINGGNISHNTDKNSKNTGRTAALWLNNINNPTYTIRGGTITNNVAVYGAINTQSDIAIEGNPVIKDNIGVGTDENSDAPMNIVLSMGIESKLNFIGDYTGSEPLGVSIYMDNVFDVTNSADVSFNNKNNVVSDNPNYGIGVYPSNHAKAGQLFYKGVATINVIDKIDDIDPMSYDGGKNDSLNDIVDATNGYNNLPQNEQDFVDGINKDVLDHDTLVYQHVDKIGDLIKAIPTPSSSDDYIDAVKLAKTEYDNLTDEEEILLNSTINFEEILIDHVNAAIVIEQITSIGDVTYNGGQDDSKDDIEAAQQAYDNLTNEQKELVNQANKDDLDDAKETYENVDDAVHAIESIGDINHGGENDSKDKINTARNTYDQLSNEQKDLVKNYQETYQDLHDAEKVYTVLEKIDDIGEGDDEEKIKIARDAYETLTSEQKELVKDVYVQKLNLAEKHSEDMNKQANILFVIFLILFIILIISGLIVLYVLLKRRKEENDENNKLVKLASVSGFLPFALFASYFTSTNFIILYVLAAIAILIWLTNLILFVSNKRQKEEKVEAKPEVVATNKPQVSQTELVNDDDEVETIKDEKGNIFQIRFIKSFTAKLIQSPFETKKYYEELKNEVLSYKKTNSRISWHYDAVNAGRNYVLKFAVRGKTLSVYLPLNTDDYTNSKYKVEKVESKKYEDVPCLYRIKNDRRLGYAKELIAVVASNLGLEKGEERHEVYSDLPYEPNKPLVARGLIKELKVQVHKPVEPQVLESKVSSDGDEVVLTKDNRGNIFEIRYIKSFTAKLSQSEDVVKDYYTILKNYALSFKGTHSRVSWHYDAINVGRDYALKFAVRGKTLCIYFALDADDYAESKYKVEKVESKRYEDTPCLYRIKNERRCEYAKDLIDEVMKKVEAPKGKEQNVDYHLPKESTKALLAKGLIKELKSKVQNQKVTKKYESISASKADEVMSDEKAEASIEEVIVHKHQEGTKEIINIDTLSEHYNNGDEVTLESLIEKKLVSSKTGHIKVLARGVLDKTLHVVANEYSLQAVKMIVLVGGSVKKVK